MLSEMKRVERFEDLIAWQKARVLTQTVYMMTRDDAHLQKTSVYRAKFNVLQYLLWLISQSALNGIAQESFISFCLVAKGSCAEVRSHLYAAYDAGYLDKERFTEVLAQVEEVGRIIGGHRVSIAGQKQQPSTRDSSLSSTQGSALRTQH